MYVMRKSGYFRGASLRVWDWFTQYFNTKYNIARMNRQTIECNQPIEVVSYKIGVCKVSNKGKSCSTTFQLVGYNEKTNISVVLCFPHSGRMHQIRVHLQYLGRLKILEIRLFLFVYNIVKFNRPKIMITEKSFTSVIAVRGRQSLFRVYRTYRYVAVFTIFSTICILLEHISKQK